VVVRREQAILDVGCPHQEQSSGRDRDARSTHPRRRMTFEVVGEPSDTPSVVDIAFADG
jgi:hypothetical protein